MSRLDRIDDLELATQLLDEDEILEVRGQVLRDSPVAS